MATALQKLTSKQRANTTTRNLAKAVDSKSASLKRARQQLAAVPSAAKTVAGVQAGAGAAGLVDSLIDDVGGVPVSAIAGLGLIAVCVATNNAHGLNIGNGMLAPLSYRLAQTKIAPMVAQKLFSKS